MSRRIYNLPHLVKCDRTGMMFPMEDMRKEYTGAWVHKSVYDRKHPQEMVRKTQPIIHPLNRPDTPMDDTLYIDYVDPDSL